MTGSGRERAGSRGGDVCTVSNIPKLDVKSCRSGFPACYPDHISRGFGENGHIAFNDPGVADLNYPLPIKCVALGEASGVNKSARAISMAGPGNETQGSFGSITAILGSDQ